jgi:hypothetical protein
MKYPLHTQSQPVSGEAAKKLLESIDFGNTVVNERLIAVAAVRQLYPARCWPTGHYAAHFRCIQKIEAFVQVLEGMIVVIGCSVVTTNFCE